MREEDGLDHDEQSNGFEDRFEDDFRQVSGHGAAGVPLNSIDNTLQKLYEQLQGGHHGCSVDQHEDQPVFCTFECKVLELLGSRVLWYSSAWFPNTRVLWYSSAWFPNTRVLCSSGLALNTWISLVGIYIRSPRLINFT
jgi:hypothetical protein